MSDAVTLESTMAAIADLWHGERCTLEFQYVPAYYANDTPEHTVVLEWTDDGGWLNNTCEYVTYRWQFDNETFAAAALDALAWVTELKVWEQCGECNAQGVWKGEPCGHCKGTGLANA